MKHQPCHKPVLVEEILKVFAENKIKFFLDGTLGAGGHADAILKSHPEIELYIGIDQDADALDIAKKRLVDFKAKCRFLRGNYKDAADMIQPLKIDGILLDLGVSSMQLDKKERGFSFQQDAFLDMRMDQRQKLSAKEVVNNFSEIKLGEIFRLYGEERYWKKAARAIVAARKKKPIKTTKQLAQTLQEARIGKKKIHPATLVFQALRVFVNDELGVLEKGLKSLPYLLNEEGKMAVIAFHSLEDRIVKNFFKNITRPTIPLDYRKKKEPAAFRLIYKKPSIAKTEEIKENPRARSAKLRAVEKLIKSKVKNKKK